MLTYGPLFFVLHPLGEKRLVFYWFLASHGHVGFQHIRPVVGMKQAS